MKTFYNYKLKELPLYEVEQRLADYKSILTSELRDHGISFDFHIWVSDDWFCPDGVPGFAVPFYLFNKELFKIHKKEVGFVEGRSEREILMLMRHELGHAMDNAYGLRRIKERQNLFGSSKKDYPESYQPQRYSKNYVHYLGDNYAQSHPDEDFAETFAYWLDPSKSWRLKSMSPKLREKLELMDRMMDGVRRAKPRLVNKFKVEAIEKNSMTLKSFYKKRQSVDKRTSEERVDHNLRSVFLSNNSSRSCVSLAGYLRREKKQHSQRIARQENVYRYEVDLVLKKLIQRAESLGIHAPMSELRRKSPSLIQRNFRYLKEKDQLKYYL